MSKSVSIIGSRGYPSYYGGFETLVRELAPFLADHGWNVRVFGRKDSVKQDDPLFDARIETVETIGVESKSLSTLSYGLTSALYCLAKPTDVALVLNVANGFWLPILKVRRIPTAINVDGIEWEREKWGKNAKRVFVAGARMTARFGDELVFDAKEIQRRWQVEFRRDGTHIAYGGSDPGETSPVAGLKPRSYVLLVARFVPENTVSEFVEAARELSESWDVVIVGSSGYGGPLEEAVRDLAFGSSRVKWLGHVNDDVLLFALWANCGLYFHGHSVGGTNPALVQAMACGAPILARDTVYNREVLQSSGEFVDPNGPAIYSAIRRLMADPARREVMSREAKARGMDAYTWQGVCRDYERLLTSMVEADGRVGN
ncbi:glycosyl transferase [Rhodococcus sp. 06-621-2]|nr:DUF1972 domain-containing protein [Rhodococcus sp. 06-621-2]OZC60250.1 glycosyl transferase [Rhodococcus sp. 06-621-2]